MKPNFFLQIKKKAPAATAVSRLTGTVTEVLDGGRLEVEFMEDGQSLGVLTGITTSPTTVIGADVPVFVDAVTGKVVSIGGPLDVDAEAELVSTGATGDLILATAEETADNAVAIAEVSGLSAELLEQIETTGEELAQWGEDLDEAQTYIDETVVPALESAQADATGAALEAANALAATFSLIKVGPDDPGHAEGRMWIQTKDGVPSGVKISDGATWVSYGLFSESLFVIGEDGTVAIRDGAIDAPKIRVSEELWAAMIAVAGDATIGGRLLVEGAIGARELNVVPDEGTGGARLNGYGLEIIPADNDGVAAIQLRSDLDTWITFVKDGDATFTVSPEGDIAGQTVTANESIMYKGEELSDLIDVLPQGVIAMTGDFPNLANVTTTYGLVEISFTATKTESRVYRVAALFPLRQYGDTIRISARYTLDGTQPNVASPYFSQQDTPATASDALFHAGFETIERLELEEGQQVRILLTVARATGSSNFAVLNSQNPRFWVEDLGADAEFGGVQNSGGGALPGSSATPPAATAPKKKIVKTVSGSWSQNFTITGAATSSLAGKAVQGDIGAGSYAARMSMIGFPSIISDLSGAEIKKIEVYVYFSHWYSSSGGTAGIGYHGQTSAPGSFSGTTASITKSGIPKPGGVWVTLPSAGWANWKSGAYRGITLRAPGDSTSREYYGYAIPDRCKIRYTYVK